jgi:hypothetical protein
MASLAAEYMVKRQSISKLHRQAAVEIRRPPQISEGQILESAQFMRLDWQWSRLGRGWAGTTTPSLGT